MTTYHNMVACLVSSWLSYIFLIYSCEIHVFFVFCLFVFVFTFFCLFCFSGLERAYVRMKFMFGLSLDFWTGSRHALSYRVWKQSIQKHAKVCSRNVHALSSSLWVKFFVLWICVLSPQGLHYRIHSVHQERPPVSKRYMSMFIKFLIMHF